MPTPIYPENEYLHEFGDDYNLAIFEDEIPTTTPAGLERESIMVALNKSSKPKPTYSQNELRQDIPPRKMPH